VHLAGVLALERREQVKKLVRLVTALGVLLLAVDDFLEDEMTARVLVQRRGLVNSLEVPDVAVQVAGHENFGRVRQLDESSTPSRGLPGGVGSFVKGAE